MNSYRLVSKTPDTISQQTLKLILQHKEKMCIFILRLNDFQRELFIEYNDVTLFTLVVKSCVTINYIKQAFN